MSLVTKSLLIDLLATESESGDCEEMAFTVSAICEELGASVTVDDVGNVSAVKGDGPCPAYVAHLDTVHPVTGQGIHPVQLNGRITGINPETMEQTGIGGDDKCGIWAALYCLENLSSCKVAFFIDEEVGCIGSGAFDVSFFHDASFILQADRRGNGDFVTEIAGMSLSSRAFQKCAKPLLKRHKFRFVSGAMTDVQVLTENGVGVSTANLSAGYYNPHQDCEYVDWKDLQNTASLMLAIGREMGGQQWHHRARRKPRSFFPDWDPQSWPDM